MPSASILVNGHGAGTGAEAPVGASDGAEVIRFGGDETLSASEAVRRASGEIVVFLGAGDRLREGAIERLARSLAAADLAYGDEIRAGVRLHKPGWSPHLLLFAPWVGHPWAVRKERALAVGGPGEDLAGAVERDLLLRLAESGAAAARIPDVLAERSGASPVDEGAHRRSVEEACRRRGILAEVSSAGAAGLLRLTPRTEEERVTVIIPTRDHLDLLRRCVTGLERDTDYGHLEILIVDNDSSDPETLRYLAASPHRVIRHPGAFDFAAIHNRVAREAAGPWLLFLNNDTEVIEPTWLRAMVSQASLPGVGAVGAWLLYPDGRVQHAGVILRPDHPVHLLRGLPESAFQHAYFGKVPCEVSAVTGACLLVRKEVFLDAGGFDQRFRIGFNDIDLCLRLRRDGYAILVDPAARLVHHEGASREEVLPLGETVLFRARWNHRFPEGDPYYHPGLDVQRADFSEL
ncbi:MAG: glycosyltransferase family 2 protein [Candidatus Binatia bacterium]